MLYPFPFSVAQLALAIGTLLTISYTPTTDLTMSANEKVADAPQPTAHLDYDHKHDLMIQRPNASCRPSMASRRMSGTEAMQMVKNDASAVDDEIADFEQQLIDNLVHAPFMNPNVTLKDPRHFTWLLVAFASMGGMLSGLDQSVISGALLYMPRDLHLNTAQTSLTSSAVPLGAIGGALILGPTNEAFGRKAAIIIALAFYTVGGALEAGAINYGMIVAARVLLGIGLGLEGGTVPVYVAESVEKKYRGNLVSLYQLMIAFGEVIGYAVAAMFVDVDGGWRYMLGSSLVFSTIMLIGMLFMPESPRMLMHKNKPLLAFAVWKRIRGTVSEENRREFFIMHHAVDSDTNVGSAEMKRTRMVWLDFFTNPRARRSIIYANLMILLGQMTGINVSSCLCGPFWILAFWRWCPPANLKLIGHLVLPLNPDEPDWIRSQDKCVHVISRWR